MPTYRVGLTTVVQIFHPGNKSTTTGGFLNSSGLGNGLQQQTADFHATHPTRQSQIILGKDVRPAVYTSYNYSWAGEGIGGVVPDEVGKKIAQGDHRYMPEV